MNSIIVLIVQVVLMGWTLVYGLTNDISYREMLAFLGVFQVLLAVIDLIRWEFLSSIHRKLLSIYWFQLVGYFTLLYLYGGHTHRKFDWNFMVYVLPWIMAFWQLGSGIYLTLVKRKTLSTS